MKKSKHTLIKEHLLLGLSITGLEALKLYGVYRLSQVILRLRRNGYDIKTDIVKIDDQPGYASYRI